MASNFSSSSATLVMICAVAAICLVQTVGAGEMGWMPTRSAGFDGELEFEMDSEINRRILATSNYISYGALQRNSVPCSRRGASYYNCQPGAQANPYNRGCSSISRCRR